MEVIRVDPSNGTIQAWIAWCVVGRYRQLIVAERVGGLPDIGSGVAHRPSAHRLIVKRKNVAKSTLGLLYLWNYLQNVKASAAISLTVAIQQKPIEKLTT